jgi:phosphate transport system substrate-binding protein
MMKGFKMRYVWLLALIFFMLSGCQERIPPTSPTPTAPASTSTALPTVAPTAAPPAVSASSYLRVDGSTSTLPLQVTIACRLLEVTCTWQEGDLFTTTWHIVPEMTSDVSDPAVETIFRLWHSGTNSAYVNLIHAEADVILVARKPSADELDEARRFGVELEVVPVARDAFVFIGHVQNPVPGLTVDQIRAIYTGQLTNWLQAGGPDQSINPYQRDRNSGSQELMEELVMRGAAMIDAPDMILEGMMGPIHAILGDPNGIGYSVYYYATRIFPQPDLKLLAIGGVAPTFDSLSSGEYPLTTEVYAVVRSSLRPSHPARQLVQWLLTPDGQDAVLESGYVPLN